MTRVYLTLCNMIQAYKWKIISKIFIMSAWIEIGFTEVRHFFISNVQSKLKEDTPSWGRPRILKKGVRKGLNPWPPGLVGGSRHCWLPDLLSVHKFMHTINNQDKNSCP